MNKFVEKYGQILLPLLTPFDENEAVAYDKYAELIEYLIRNDLCDSLIVTGTTGEASLLTFDERVKLFETAVKASAGRKPVIAGTGCASTKETVALTNEAVKLGIETCLVVCPFYNKPTQEGLYRHYKKLAESTKANIMLYNIPIFVGVNLEAETVHRLAAIPNIVGVKDEAGINPTQVTDFFLATKDVDPDFAIYNGDDVMLLPTIVQGAMGLVSGGAHIFGHEIRAIFKAFAEGDNEKAKELFVPIYRFCKSTGQNGRILPNSILRPAVEAVTGVRIGPARGPLAPATDEEMEVTLGILKEIGKL
ncbi:4-hydroxy-tetrahydrodipicolinate synthase [Caproiciproducens sp. NJN-50]|uniref:4-hydroxy-tetrahydrodipicolinate synthase n=1 Tax=Caproiciproducens sp. NJN-50 TaxID=2507162 RepID=UPI000FFE2C63|nr:4-hydroxy-tetrahydrodipicolinate synthase [Caproiciproducens sp. NJN-50]QAT50542.1 4-hydroxy-tetrahydrodipicolinate synthase [Caproiciproducens sp. NJN-50]